MKFFLGLKNIESKTPVVVKKSIKPNPCKCIIAMADQSTIPPSKIKKPMIAVRVCMK
jgi:hypothetical protein